MRIGRVALALVTWVGASAAEAGDPPSLTFGLRLQGWYVGEQHGAADGGTAHDFLLRRGYLSVTGKLSSSVSAFAHVSGDRIGQTQQAAAGVSERVQGNNPPKSSVLAATGSQCSRSGGRRSCTPVRTRAGSRS